MISQGIMPRWSLLASFVFALLFNPLQIIQPTQAQQATRPDSLKKLSIWSIFLDKTRRAYYRKRQEF
jgi:hypothetical protein